MRLCHLQMKKNTHLKIIYQDDLDILNRLQQSGKFQNDFSILNEDLIVNQQKKRILTKF